MIEFYAVNMRGREGVSVCQCSSTHRCMSSALLIYLRHLRHLRGLRERKGLAGAIA